MYVSIDLFLLPHLLWLLHRFYHSYNNTIPTYLPTCYNRGHEQSNNHFLCKIQVFLNIVLDEAVEEKAGGEKVRIGMVVSCLAIRSFTPTPTTWADFLFRTGKKPWLIANSRGSRS